MEIMFSRHSSHLSDNFWEALEQSMETKEHSITANISSTFLSERIEAYTAAVKDKFLALNKVFGFGEIIGKL